MGRAGGKRESHLARVRSCRTYKTDPLASSARVLAYRAKRHIPLPFGMALVTIEKVESAKAEQEILAPPPAVITTPCDPWPRPYYLENGLRRVLPYHYTYNTYCKERWRDRELLDIFATEFRDRPLEYYVEHLCTKLMGPYLQMVARRHRARKCCHQWAKGTFGYSSCQERRCDISYSASA